MDHLQLAMFLRQLHREPLSISGKLPLLASTTCLVAFQVLEQHLHGRQVLQPWQHISLNGGLWQMALQLEVRVLGTSSCPLSLDSAWMCSDSRVPCWFCQDSCCTSVSALFSCVLRNFMYGTQWNWSVWRTLKQKLTLLVQSVVLTRSSAPEIVQNQRPIFLIGRFWKIHSSSCMDCHRSSFSVDSLVCSW